MNIAGILLAAGSARRFGKSKLLHPMADGTLIGVAAGRNLVRAVPNSVAVVRPGDDELIDALSAVGLTIVENPLTNDGLGSSLAAGARATAHASGWLMALADMPWIDPATIHSLADGLREGAPIIAPAYRGRRGHPVGFASEWKEQLQALEGDQGAQGILAAHPDRLQIQITNDAGVLADIDYPHDLDQLDA